MIFIFLSRAFFLLRADGIVRKGGEKEGQRRMCGITPPGPQKDPLLPMDERAKRRTRRKDALFDVKVRVPWLSTQRSFNGSCASWLYDFGRRHCPLSSSFRRRSRRHRRNGWLVRCIGQACVGRPWRCRSFAGRQSGSRRQPEAFFHEALSSSLLQAFEYW